ncbi:peptidoglycan-binding protein [Clostridia bacterium]|nr:peptidoglycan-binding protein [Clostridia bacterium]
MFVGVPVVYLPVEKMCIIVLDKQKKEKEKIYVMYNPESYVQSSSIEYGDKKGVAQSKSNPQYSSGASETVSMELFFDTASSLYGGGSMPDKATLAAGSLLPSPAKEDIRKYTDKIYNLMHDEDGDEHKPPNLKIQWASLIFEGKLVSCSQKFTKFNETGAPVRATLSVKFLRSTSLTEAAAEIPQGSPDTSKFRMVHQGDSLWALSEKEYGDCGSWRLIAAANNIENPRMLETGASLRVPAIKK